MVSVSVLLVTIIVAVVIISIMSMVIIDLIDDRNWWKKQAKDWRDNSYNATNQLFYQRMRTISAVMAASRTLRHTTDAIEIAEGWKNLYMSLKGKNND